MGSSSTGEMDNANSQNIYSKSPLNLCHRVCMVLLGMYIVQVSNMCSCLTSFQPLRTSIPLHVYALISVSLTRISEFQRSLLRSTNMHIEVLEDTPTPLSLFQNLNAPS